VKCDTGGMHRGTRHSTDQDGLAAMATVAAAVVAVVVVAGGAWAITRAGGGSSGPAADPGTTPTVTVSTPSERTSPTGGHSAGWPQGCTDAARKASAAGLGVMATAQLPSGWKVMSCDFNTGKSVWNIDVDSPGGPFLLVQQKGTENDAVQKFLPHFTQGAQVTADGTGVWHVWNGPKGEVALTKGLSSSAVVLESKQSAKALTDFAGLLLTYEDAPAGNNGG
jgi:hypothetical protein